MKSFWILLVLVILSGISTLTWAQSQTGNGGRAIVCFGKPDPATGGQPIVSAKLTDLEEAVLTQWTITLGQDRIMTEADAYVTALEAVNRLALRDAVLANELKLIILQMQKERHLLYWESKGLTINKIMDANTAVKSINANCIELQAAFSKTAPQPMEYRFVFVGNVIEKMTNRHLAALILHEALYYREAQLGATSSDGLRKVVRAMTSTELDTITSRTWFEIASTSLQKMWVTEGEYTFESVSRWLDDGRVAQGIVSIGPVAKIIFPADCPGGSGSACGMRVATLTSNQWEPAGRDGFLRTESGLEGRTGNFYPYPDLTYRGFKRVISTSALKWINGKLTEAGLENAWYEDLGEHNHFDPDTLNPIQSLWRTIHFAFYAELANNQEEVSIKPFRDLKIKKSIYTSKVSDGFYTFITYDNGHPKEAIFFLKPSQWRKSWPRHLSYSASIGSGKVSVLEVGKYQGIRYRIENHRIVDAPEVVELPEAIRNL